MISSVFAQPKASDAFVSFSSWPIRSDSDSVAVCFVYAVPFRHLVFSKSAGYPSSFRADLSFSADALDSLTGRNFHADCKKDVTAAGYAESRSDARLAEDFLRLTLPRSVFQISLELSDRNLGLTYRNQTIGTGFSRFDSAGITSVMFLDSLSDNEFYPVPVNDVAPFPQPIRLLALISSGGPDSVSSSLTTAGGIPAGKPAYFKTRSGRIEPSSGGKTFSFTHLADSSYTLLVCGIDADTLKEGNYEITLSIGKRSQVYRFRYVWLDKPRTLMNRQTAVSLLKYIAPDSIYSLVSSGNDDEASCAFDNFWKSHDPTPATAYNEAEAEFYRRADYARDEFSTIGTRDGAATDRGKAYILFGKPASVNREYRGDATYELWSYPKLGRRLLFKEKGFGDFDLFQTENL